LKVNSQKAERIDSFVYAARLQIRNLEQMTQAAEKARSASTLVGGIVLK